MAPIPRRDKRGRWAALALCALLALLVARWLAREVPPTQTVAPAAPRPVRVARSGPALDRPSDDVDEEDTPEAAAEGPSPLNVAATALDNGLTLWVIEDHSAPIVAARVAFGVGSVDDPPGHGGLAHFVEHLMFQGTDRLGTVDWRRERPALEAEGRRIAARADATAERPDDFPLDRSVPVGTDASSRYVAPNEVFRVLGALGATEVNASTDREVTRFQATLPANQVRRWAVTMAEALRHPVFRGFARERTVVGHEREYRQHGWGPVEDLDAALFGQHPYGAPVIGTLRSLAVTDVEDAAAFHARWYTPENALVVLVGDVTLADARAMAAETFGAWTPSRAPKRARVARVRRLERRAVASATDPYTTTITWPLPAGAAPEVVAVLTAALSAELAEDVPVVETGFARWSAGGRLWVRCTSPGDDDCEEVAVRAARTLALQGAPPGLIRAAARSAWVEQLRSLEAHGARADALVESWGRGEPPGEPWAWRTRLRSVAVAQVAEAAKSLQGYVVSPRGPVDLRADAPAPAPVGAADPDAWSTFATEVLAMPVPPLDPAWRTRGEDWTEAANGAVIAARNPVNPVFEARIRWPTGWRDDPLACAALAAWGHQLETEGPRYRSLHQGAVRVVAPSCTWDAASLVLYGPDTEAAAALTAAWPVPRDLVVDDRWIEAWQHDWLDRGWWLRFGRPVVRTDARDPDELRAALARLVARPARLFYSGAATADTVVRWVNGDAPSPGDARAPLEPVAWSQTELVGARTGLGVLVVRSSEPYDPEREGLYALYAAWLGGPAGAVATELRGRRGEVYGAAVSYVRGRRPGEPNTLFVDIPGCPSAQVALDLDAVLRSTGISEARWAELRAASLESAWSGWVSFRDLPAAAGNWLAAGLDTDAREVRYAQIQDVDRAAFEAFVAAEAARPARWYVEGPAFDADVLRPIAPASEVDGR